MTHTAKANDGMPLTLDDILGVAGGRLGRGKKSQTKEGFSRELTEDDLREALAPAGSKSPAPLELKTSHHQLARLLAQGKKQVEISAITGYSQSRISILKSSPAFQELLAHYEELEKEGYKIARADMKERLATVGFNSIEVLQSRLDDDPDSFSNKDLLSIIEASADRTGHGKTATLNANVTHALDEATLARIRNEASSTPSALPLPESDRAALLGFARRAAAVHSDEQEAGWIEGEGVLVREESHQGAEEAKAGEA
jgi:hypothetical protein